MSLPFSIIVAVDQEDGIGLKGQIPWSLSQDLKHFKEITTQTRDPQRKNIVVMGRKTWASIPERFRPLSGRINIILSRQDYALGAEDVYHAPSFEDAFRLIGPVIDPHTFENIFIIGGAEVYALALKSFSCRRIYLTRVLKTFSCDTHFRSYQDCFKEVHRSAMMTENNLSFYFSEYQRMNGEADKI